MNLSESDFISYFKAVHGKQPFPWQKKLLENVLAQGWPEAIRLPTASGKTAVLDVAVFALACQAHLPPAQRLAPRRIVLVVDRRIVVDDAFERAKRICKALTDATTGVLGEVKAALLSLGGEEPLQVAALRGGLYREDRWARTPLQPVILCSTVDQVGSRLLFRGYGISSSMWPIHAGLLGNDCLIVLDEAHCSRPFLQTLTAIGKMRALAAQPLTAPFAAVAMTATPHSNASPFELTAADRKHPLLAARLTASKPAVLVSAKGKKDADLVAAAITALRPLCHPGATVLAVFNRVAPARALRQELAKLAMARKDNLGVDAILLTGRCRSLERDNLLKTWLPRLMAGRDRQAVANEKPLVVVATQCVEVGADLDVDALITECAPLDALRQRFGRLDRLGQLHDLKRQAQAVILCRADHAETDAAKAPADDPVYGQALARTWRWLKANATDDVIDFGIQALDAKLAGISADELTQMTAPAPDAPVLFPAYCDLWAQTGPEPAVSPEPAIFLHGPDRGQPEVQLVWRADLSPDQPGTWADTISLCPPVAGEVLPLPLWQARAWLAQAAGTEALSDLEGAPGPLAEDEIATAIPRPVLRWRGPENSELANSPQGIRPGDLLVLPASYGGCDSEGWNPDYQKAVQDLADSARHHARRSIALRLTPAMLALPEWQTFADALRPFAEQSGDEWPDDLRGQLRNVLTEQSTRIDVPAVSAAIHAVLQILNEDRKFGMEPHPAGQGMVLLSRQRQGTEDADFSDEDSGSARAREAVPLSAHLVDVGDWVKRFITATGLEALEPALLLAAVGHDQGKRDPRFQAWLYGGNRIRALQGGLLAKSEMLPSSAAAMTAARIKSGYPDGARHELLSVRLLESAPEINALAPDMRDLFLHLVASHHGHCRPFAPVVIDEHPVSVTVEHQGQTLRAGSDTKLERLDSGVAERFWTLVRRHGWWGLAYLEACLRLADHRASENPGSGRNAP